MNCNRPIGSRKRQIPPYFSRPSRQHLKRPGDRPGKNQMTSVSHTFDYIVVGAGSAGCVVASRLVKDHGATVLLLEAGPLDDNMLIHMPAGAVKIVFGKSRYIKRYTSTPQPVLEGRAVDIMHGNVVGGGSSVNAMTYAPASKDDYDRWTTLSGAPRWDWDNRF